MATFCQLKITQLAGSAISRSCSADGARITTRRGVALPISRANFEPIRARRRRYTSPEDPRNNLGASTTGESLENHVHARLIPELHRVDWGNRGNGGVTRSPDRATFPRIIFPDFRSRDSVETRCANIESNSRLNFNGRDFQAFRHVFISAVGCPLRSGGIAF